MYHLVKNASYCDTFSWGKCYITIITHSGQKNSMFRRPGTTYFFHRASEPWFFLPNDSIYLKANTVLGTGLTVIQSQPSWSFIPCILVQDKAETCLNRK